jgi:hypothetical protein
MSNKDKKYPEYMEYPEDVKHRIENIFSWTLEHCPYPESIKDRVAWIHSMEKTLRDIESESLVLSKQTK